MIVDLAHTEGNEQVAPNQFRKITAGYPLQIGKQWFLVLAITQTNPIRPLDGSDDLIVAIMHVLKLTNTGAYSKAKNSYGVFDVRSSGIVESWRARGSIWHSIAIRNEYNAVVRDGKNTGFRRNRYFDKGIQEGIEAERAIESHKTWEGWTTEKNSNPTPRRRKGRIT